MVREENNQCFKLRSTPLIIIPLLQYFFQLISKTVKFNLWDLVQLHYLGAFLVVVTVDSGCQDLH